MTMKRLRVGFTVVEVLVVIIVISILATLVILGYGAWQHSIADSNVQSDVQQATSAVC